MANFDSSSHRRFLVESENPPFDYGQPHPQPPIYWKPRAARNFRLVLWIFVACCVVILIITIESWNNSSGVRANLNQTSRR